MNHHEKLNYVEFTANNLPATKAFFQAAFNWACKDYGPEYIAFSNEGLDGGFFKASNLELASTTDKGGALLVFYSSQLEATLAKVETAGGKVNKPIFTFPGGRRFHFIEPSGNEFAVWSDF
jgi:predicted enzyme related to lactoylglutathione lyase